LAQVGTFVLLSLSLQSGAPRKYDTVGPMAVVADSAAYGALHALEARLRSQAQERERCIKDELRADLKAELASEQERRLLAERRVRHLRTEVQKLREDEGDFTADFEADDRDDPRFMEEMCLMAAPKSAAIKRQISDEPDPTRQVSNDNNRVAALSDLSDGIFEEDGTYKEGVMSAEMLEGVEFDFKDLPCDIWGVAIMTLTRDVGELLNGHDFCAHLTRFIYAMICVALNLTLQLSILVWVNKYVVGESVWTIQGNYAKFRKDVFDHQGQFKEQAWVDWDGPRDDLCGAVLTKTVFLGAILFLWIGRMLGEFKSIVRLSQDLYAIPRAPSGAAHQHSILERSGHHAIIALTTGMRITLFCMVIFPKFVINITLALIGLQWLTATENFADLILSALALEFVIGIDEQILEYFLPKRCADNLQATKFAIVAVINNDKDAVMQRMVKDYNRNIFYFLLAVAMTIVYVLYVQQVLPFYEGDIVQHCGLWYENRFHPRCEPFEKNCFPYGKTTQAHDYGMMTPKDEEGLLAALLPKQ